VNLKETSIPQSKPITVQSYPTPLSINAQNPNNFHVNMNITNININKPQNKSKNLKATITCDRDFRVNYLLF